MSELSTISALKASPYSGADYSLSPTANKGEQDIDAIAKDFESVFLSQMMSHMFAGDDANSYFGSGAAGDIYKGFLMNEYGKAVANAGGIGIAGTIRSELLKLQEVSS